MRGISKGNQRRELYCEGSIRWWNRKIAVVETKNIQDIYDVAIIGGGVCGTALLYSLSNYTNVGKIALIEKNAEVALVNSKYSSNSQTLHFGDIETNYSLEKATRVNEAATMVKQYVLKHDPNQEIYTKYHKMVLAVGEEEADFLRERYETFKGSIS